MLEFFERRRLRRVLYSYPVIGLVGIVAVLMLLPAWSAYSKMHATAEKREEAAAELAHLSAREEALAEEIERLSSERGVEEELRRKFEVGHEGEELIVIVGLERTEPVAPAPEPEPTWRDRVREAFPLW
ncbi:hypothetical protein GVX82_00625 [Patescibacteria group bacterium]|jgi:cell division protein FtsB|nr:hypothetical protein [Patescibacteria group bacterium]